MLRLHARPYALATILARLPPVMKCLAAVEPGTDQDLSMDCYRCPSGNDAVLGIRQQRGKPEKVVRRGLIIGGGVNSHPDLRATFGATLIKRAAFWYQLLVLKSVV